LTTSPVDSFKQTVWKIEYPLGQTSWGPCAKERSGADRRLSRQVAMRLAFPEHRNVPWAFNAETMIVSLLDGVDAGMAGHLRLVQ